jgi:hypothetical protein
MPSTENDESQLAYLKDQIASQLGRLYKSSHSYRKKARKLQKWTLALSALITFFTGLKLAWLPLSISSKAPGVGTDIVLALATASTAIAAWGAFYSPMDSWHLNTDTYSRMRGLQTKLEFLERAPDFESNKAEILKQSFDEYQAILADSNKRWDDVRAQTK